MEFLGAPRLFPIRFQYSLDMRALAVSKSEQSESFEFVNRLGKSLVTFRDE